MFREVQIETLSFLFKSGDRRNDTICSRMLIHSGIRLAVGESVCKCKHLRSNLKTPTHDVLFYVAREIRARLGLPSFTATCGNLEHPFGKLHVA